jgi:hypothetical protein
MFHEFESDLRANHTLSGVCLHIPWSGIEKQAAKTDFTVLDKTIAVFRETRPNINSVCIPALILPILFDTEGGKRSRRKRKSSSGKLWQSAQNSCSLGSGLPRYFSDIIQQLGKRYATDPLCESVVLTCANFMSAEMHLPKSPRIGCAGSH